MKQNFINSFKREPITAAAAISAGAALAGQGANAAIQGKMNLKTRQFAEEMYFRQRKDALADWNMQNAYNSPEQQMARYKAAGLNPHLIYDQNTQSPTVRSTDAQPWHPEAPKFDGGAVSRAYFDTQQQMVTMQGQRKQQQLMDQEIELKRAQTIFQNVQSETGTFDLNLKKVLQDNNISLAKSNLESRQWDVSKQIQDYEFSRSNQSMKIQQNDLDAANKAQTLELGVQSVLNSIKSRQKTDKDIEQMNIISENLKKDGRIKELDAKLADMHVRPGDPLWQRYLNVILNKYFPKSK